MTTELQKKTAQAIVNIFETGRVGGDYTAVTFHPGDPGHLTYGRSQTTLASGNLYLLTKRYCDAPDAELAPQLTPYLGRLASRDTNLDHDKHLRDCLVTAGSDPVMRKVQDQFFDEVYWAPSVTCAESAGIESALGRSVVYDSCVHGSWRRVQQMTDAGGTLAAVGEHGWVQRYVQTRRAWLAGHNIRLLNRTVYRMDAFEQLISANKWELDLPLRVRGIEITESMLDPTVRVSAHDCADDERILRLESPFMKGADVREVQEALNRRGARTTVDTVFGPQTARAVIAFQKARGLTADGIVGPATRAALGLGCGHSDR